MANKTNTSTTPTATGPGLLGFLGLMFIAFKLLGITVVATWSWWLVLLPIWGPLALLLVILLIVGIIFLISVLRK